MNKGCLLKRVFKKTCAIQHMNVMQNEKCDQKKLRSLLLNMSTQSKD